MRLKLEVNLKFIQNLTIRLFEKKNNFKDFRFTTWEGVVTIYFKNCRRILMKDENKEFLLTPLHCQPNKL